MDAINELFAWAEDNHYLQKTALMIKKASREFKEIETELTTIRTELAETKRRLVEAREELNKIAEMSKKYVVFKPQIGSPELWKVLGDIFEVAQQALLPRIETASAYVSKTELGKKLMALRNKAISEGMTLLSADEITGGDCMIVRRDSLKHLIAVIHACDCDCCTGECLDCSIGKTALNLGQEIPESEGKI